MTIGEPCKECGYIQTASKKLFQHTAWCSQDTYFKALKGKKKGRPKAPPTDKVMREWQPISELVKQGFTHFWVMMDKDHFPEIIGLDEVPNHFWCKAGLFDNLSNIMHKLALPIRLPPPPTAGESK